jgi:hypothetical protein
MPLGTILLIILIFFSLVHFRLGHIAVTGAIIPPVA